MKSSVREEIRRGFYNGQYKAHIAETRSQRNIQKSHTHYKWRDEHLLPFIERHIYLKWSPEIIAVMWNKDHSHHISYTMIYRQIRAPKPEWRKYLIYNDIHKYKKGSLKKIMIPNRIDIISRPIEINSRDRVGNIEADTVISSRGSKSCLAVFVDRKTRFYWIRKIKSKSALDMSKVTCFTLKDIPVKTITYDNGSENTHHKYVNRKLKCKSFFCRLYCTVDKGSIENKILHQFLPKKTNFDLSSGDPLANIQVLINNRPLKILN